MRLTAVRGAIAAMIAAVTGSTIMALLERLFSYHPGGPIDFFPGIYVIVAAVAFPFCLAGMLIAEQFLLRFDRTARLNTIGWAFVIGGVAGAIVCLPFVLFGGAEPTLGPVFGAASGVAYLIVSQRRPAARESQTVVAEEKSNG